MVPELPLVSMCGNSLQTLVMFAIVMSFLQWPPSWNPFLSECRMRQNRNQASPQKYGTLDVCSILLLSQKEVRNWGFSPDLCIRVTEEEAWHVNDTDFPTRFNADLLGYALFERWETLNCFLSFLQVNWPMYCYVIVSMGKEGVRLSLLSCCHYQVFLKSIYVSPCD